MPHSRAAAEFVSERFQSTLPPGAPLPFTIVRAEMREFKKLKPKADQHAVAEVKMFDGKPASIEIMVKNGITRYRWLFQESDFSFEDGKWTRVLAPIDCEVTA